MYEGTDRQSAKRSGRTLYLTRLALLTAVMIIMSFTPLGYFRTPLLSISLMAAPVAIGGILFGPLAGAFCGIIFGATSLINAISGGGLTGMLLLINPVGGLFIIFIPRILCGYLSALIFCLFKRYKAKRLGVFVSSLCCPVLNTLLFTGSLVLIFFKSDYIQGLASSLGTSDPLMFITAIIGVQGILEAVVCCISADFISLTLLYMIKSE